MGGWVVSERRGPPQRQSWTERSISSIGAIGIGPSPLPLLAVFAILFFYLHLSDSYQRALVCFKLLLYLLPVLLIFFARSSNSNDDVPIMIPDRQRGAAAGTSPWRVALLLLLLLLFISYHPSLKSKWFGNVSSSH